MATRISRKIPRKLTGAEAPDLARRTPYQARAVETVEAIFEATARILEREGIDGASTNRIAERAGISIGTLYQYFPNKTAILIAMARRELERDRAAVEQAVAGLSDPSREELAGAVVRSLIRVHRNRHQVRRHIMQVHHEQGFGKEHITPVEELSQRIGTLAGMQPPESPHSPRAVRLFVVSRAVIGVIRSATLEDPSLLDQQEFETQVIALALRFLAGGA